MPVFLLAYVNMVIKLSVKSLESCSRSMSCQKFEVLDLPVGGDLRSILFRDFCAGGKCC